ncbi:hypothetical protein L7F22_024093 [Adiantum nelumboides]|nr:hypothetical protein [Adiantum nelumboides]
MIQAHLRRYWSYSQQDTGCTVDRVSPELSRPLHILSSKMSMCLCGEFSRIPSPSSKIYHRRRIATTINRVWSHRGRHISIRSPETLGNEDYIRFCFQGALNFSVKHYVCAKVRSVCMHFAADDRHSLRLHPSPAHHTSELDHSREEKSYAKVIFHISLAPSGSQW